MLRAFAGVVALDDGACGDATAGDDRTAERNPRIDDNDLRLIGMAWSREGEQPRRDAVCVMLDPPEVRFKCFSERNLAASRSDDQVAELFDEQVDAVRLKLLCRKRVPVTKLTLDIIQSGPHLTELHLVHVT